MCPLLSPLAVPGAVLVCARWSGFTRQHSQQCLGLPPKCSGYPTYKNSLLALPTFISSHASHFVMLSLHGFLIQIGSPQTIHPVKAGAVSVWSLLCLGGLAQGLAHSGLHSCL